MASSWHQKFYENKLTYDFQGKKESQEFEDLFDKVRDKNATAVVVQLTDDWKMQDETFDGSILEWSKQKRKNFIERYLWWC